MAPPSPFAGGSSGKELATFSLNTAIVRRSAAAQHRRPRRSPRAVLRFLSYFSSLKQSST
jgi:hypothetical protein